MEKIPKHFSIQIPEEKALNDIQFSEEAKRKLESSLYILAIRLGLEVDEVAKLPKEFWVTIDNNLAIVIDLRSLNLSGTQQEIIEVPSGKWKT